MLIPTAVGINTLGQPAGPSTTRWILPLDLEEVSTIVPGQPGTQDDVTRAMTLSDLGTDCPQSVDATAIATLASDGRCNPILAAPSQVRSWAYPCNACGRFGLFDPPYAVPTLTGGLVEPPPTTTATAVVVPTSAVVSATAGTTTAVVTRTAVTSAQDPAFSSSTSTAAAGTTSAVATAAGARCEVGKGAGVWLIPVWSVVIAIFWL